MFEQRISMLLKWLSYPSLLSQGCAICGATVYHNCSWKSEKFGSHVITNMKINSKIAIPCGKRGIRFTRQRIKLKFFVCFSLSEIFILIFSPLFCVFLFTLLWFPTECWWVKEMWFWSDFKVSFSTVYNLVAGSFADWYGGGKCFFFTSWSGKEVCVALITTSVASRHFRAA